MKGTDPMPTLANDQDISAAFDKMLATEPKIRRLLNALGVTATAACRQSFLAGFIQGQADALKYHTESMRNAKRGRTDNN